MLRACEGYNYERTLKELKEIFPPSDNMAVEGDEHGLEGAPAALQTMFPCRTAMTALGGLMWYLRTLNIDRDILTMGNFNVLGGGEGAERMEMDGGTLRGVEVLTFFLGGADLGRRLMQEKNRSYRTAKAPSKAHF
jgi:DNA mismatch repair protein MSH6